MNNDRRIAIIYAPNGSQFTYTTSAEVHASDSSYRLVDKIVADGPVVNIAWKEDGKVEGVAYHGMPYVLQMWQKE